MCNHFEILHPIHSIDAMHDRISHNILNQLNKDFRLEISAALDLTHTKMTGKEILYRAIRLNFSDQEIFKIFESGHTKLSKGVSYLLYDKQLEWNPEVGDWDANLVYTSFDPSISASYVYNSNNGILFEYRPQAGELSIEGQLFAENQTEVRYYLII